MKIETESDLRRAAELLKDDRLAERVVGLSARVVLGALFRLDSLKRFWEAERAANFRSRWKVAQKVIDQIKDGDPLAPIALSTLQHWEKSIREQGIQGLIERPKGPRKRRAQDV